MVDWSTYNWTSLKWAQKNRMVFVSPEESDVPLLQPPYSSDGMLFVPPGETDSSDSNADSNSGWDTTNNHSTINDQTNNGMIISEWSQVNKQDNINMREGTYNLPRQCRSWCHRRILLQPNLIFGCTCWFTIVSHACLQQMGPSYPNSQIGSWYQVYINKWW